MELDYTYMEMQAEFKHLIEGMKNFWKHEFARRRGNRRR